MEIYLIELTNSSAQGLLHDLENLKIIKILKKSEREGQEINKSNTARFRGALKLSKEQYLNFQQHAKDIRNEWRENI